MSATNTMTEEIPATLKPSKKRRIATLPETSAQQTPKESNPTETSAAVSSEKDTLSENVSLVLDPLLAPGIKQMEDDIRHMHSMVNRTSMDILVIAAKCGLLLQLGQQIAGHGNFKKWVAERNFGFGKTSQYNYIHFADHLKSLAKSSTVGLLNVELSKEEQLLSYSFNEEALKTLVNDASKGRSLTDLYVDWGITKPAPNKSGNSSKAPSGAEMLKPIMMALDGLPNIFQQLKSDQKSYLIEKMESMLTTLKSSNHDEKASQ